MEYVTILTNYIKKKYESLDIKSIGGKNNINRYTKPIMSQYVENAIALLINSIKNNNNLNYVIDAQLSIGSKQPIRPDIIIYDENNVIHAIIEVKSQLGYCGSFTKESYDNKINLLKKASTEGKLKLKNGKDDYLNFTISKKCKDFIVILMSENSHGNVKKFDNMNYFILFSSNQQEKVWYDNLTANLINKDINGFEEFIKYVKKI